MVKSKTNANGPQRRVETVTGDRRQALASRTRDKQYSRGASGTRPGKIRRRADLDLNTGDRLIDLTALKIAVRVLPAGSVARQLIMEEPDQILKSEYCVKIGIWFKLMRNPTEE